MRGARAGGTVGWLVVAALVASAAPARANELKWRGWVTSELVTAMAERPLVKVKKRYNTFQPVFRLELEGGLEVAFRPRSQPFTELWKSEVVAWELAKLLGIADRVPPVATRSVPLAALDAPKRSQLEPSKDDPDMVFGSVTFWMPVLEPTGLAGKSGQKRWGRWLDVKKRLAAKHEKLAEQMSTMVVFDYLQANNDRFQNGPNMMADEHGDLVYRDNSDAWTSGRLGKLELNEKYLKMTRRFSKKVVAALREADEEALAAATQKWLDAGHKVIAKKALRLYEKRRRRVLKHVDKLIKRFGEERVLAFP